jgi:hypothetical protein
MLRGPAFQDHGYGYRDEDGGMGKDVVRFGVHFPDGGKLRLDDAGTPEVGAGDQASE